MTQDVTGLVERINVAVEDGCTCDRCVLEREASSLLTAQAERIAELEREVRMGERALKSSEAFVAEVQRDLAAAREALDKYGQHESHCNKSWNLDYYKCECGLDAARSK